MAPDFSKSDPENAEIEDDRYRFKWQHRTDIDDYTNIIVEYNKLHDEYFLKDYFENEYKEEADPETYAILTRNRERYGFLLNYERRANHFYKTIEKLPEARFNWNNQEIGNSNVYFENEASGISFNRKRARSGVDDDVVRLDLYNKVSYPVQYFRYNFLPYLYSRHDYYSKDKEGKEDITRGAYGGGVDLNTRYFKTFDVVSDTLGIDINKLRHILEPSVGYASTREASVRKARLFQMDEIDAEDDFDEVTFGLRNKLQTKRLVKEEWKRVDLFVIDNKINYEFNREETDCSTWLNHQTELEFRPYSWLTLYHENIWDVRRDQFSSAEFDIEIEPTDRWHFWLSHRFIKDRDDDDDDDDYDDYYDDDDEDNDASSLVTFDAEYKINELWKVGGYLRHEFDDSRAEEMELRFIRDLHCWLLDFGINQRENEEDEKDYEIFVNLRMKAFPDVMLKTGNRATYSRSRYGSLIAGAQ
jgi:hypothetical protein